MAKKKYRMSPESRKKVSRRMKRLWKQRREAKLQNRVSTQIAEGNKALGSVVYDEMARPKSDAFIKVIAAVDKFTKAMQKSEAKRRKKMTPLERCEQAYEEALADNTSFKLQINQLLEDVNRKVEPPPPFFWRTSDGRTLKPSEMEEGHLRNTISFLQRSIVADCGRVTYLNTLRNKFEAMTHMLAEATKRGFQV